MSNFVKVQTGVLSNGMEFSYLCLPKAKKVNVMLNVPVGAMHDPEGKEGLSHILEHTVFCGLENMTEEEFKGTLHALGGGMNASTGTERTTFDLWASAQDPENFSVIADLMRQIITEPAFPDQRVENEKRVIVNEWADGIDDLFRGPMLQVSRNIYAGQKPYTNIIGDDRSINAVTSDCLRLFMQDTYDAGHMRAYATGPLPFDQAREVLEQTLSAVPDKGNPLLSRDDASYQVSDERSHRPDLKQNYMSLIFVTPKSTTLREYLAFNQARTLLSKLSVDVLRSQHGCFYSPKSGGWSFNQRSCQTYMHMSGTPEDSVVAANALTVFAQDIGKHLSDDVINGALQAAIYEHEDCDVFTVNKLNEVMDLYNVLGVDFDSEAIVQAYEAITPEDVRHQARLTLAGLTGMYVQGPEPYKPPALEVLREAMPKVEASAPSAARGFNRSVGP